MRVWVLSARRVPIWGCHCLLHGPWGSPWSCGVQGCWWALPAVRPPLPFQSGRPLSSPSDWGSPDLRSCTLGDLSVIPSPTPSSPFHLCLSLSSSNSSPCFCLCRGPRGTASSLPQHSCKPFLGGLLPPHLVTEVWLRMEGSGQWACMASARTWWPPLIPQVAAPAPRPP